MDMDVANFHLTNENDEPASKLEATLAENLLEAKNNAKILAFKDKAPAPKPGQSNELRVLYSTNRGESDVSVKAHRHIPQQPQRVLDAPDLRDDYYLNLMDWNDGNVLAIALDRTVYLWNATTCSIDRLMSVDDADNYITSVSWAAEGSFLAVGTNTNDVQIFDAGALRKIRTMRSHEARVGSLAWNSWMLSSGSRDSTIHNHDVRVAEHHIGTLEGHHQEVCGLKWSGDGNQLASGGNDNLLHIWDARTTTPKFQLQDHQAAVKALAWAPWQHNLLASGGGTADRCIKFWNTTTGACLNSIDTKSQVCALQWSRHDKEVRNSAWAVCVRDTSRVVLTPAPRFDTTARLVARLLAQPAVPVVLSDHGQACRAYGAHRARSRIGRRSGRLDRRLAERRRVLEVLVHLCRARQKVQEDGRRRRLCLCRHEHPLIAERGAPA